MNTMINTSDNSRSHVVALLLAIFFGGLGLHRFYLGRVGTGLLRIACLPLAFIPILGIGLLLIIHVVDIILVVSKALRPAGGAVYA